MRVVLAGLFVFAGLMAGAGLVFTVFPEGTSPALLGIGLGIWMLALATGAMYLFHRPGRRPGESTTAEEHIRQLDAQGMLTSTDFRARRVFAVKEFEDEGLHYFLELENDSVLYLTGQYLYDYEAIDDDPDLNQARQFPCSDFTIRRHRDEGYVVDIVCRGPLLKLEGTMPSFVQADFRHDRVAEDGQIITEKTFDGLKAANGRLN